MDNLVYTLGSGQKRKARINEEGVKQFKDAAHRWQPVPPSRKSFVVGADVLEVREPKGVGAWGDATQVQNSIVPLEVLNLIFANVDYATLVDVIPYVCRDWRDACSVVKYHPDARGFLQREHTNFRQQLREPNSEWAQWVAERFEWLRKLDMRGFGGENIDDVLVCVGSLRNLAFLDLRNNDITDTGLEHVGRLTRLTHLCIGNYIQEGQPRLRVNVPACTISDTGLEHIAGLTQLTHLYMGYCSEITAAGLKHIAGLKHLTSLELEECPITDAGLAHIATLTQLTRLSLHDVPDAYRDYDISNAGLAHIGVLKQLTSLSLLGYSFTDIWHLGGLVHLASLEMIRCSQLTDDGLEKLANVVETATMELTDLNLDRSGKGISAAGLGHIARCFPHLARLDLSSCSCTGIGGLNSLTQLTHLDLSSCREITDAGLHAAGLTQLTHLNLGGAGKGHLSSKALAHVADWTELTYLDLSMWRNITDSGLQHLAGLKHLTHLNMCDCGTTGGAGLGYVTHLTHLDLQGSGITDAVLERVAGLTQLTSLNLTGCCDITDAGFAVVGAGGFKKLTSLNLLRCEEITDAGLAHLASAATELTSLTLGGYNCAITDTGIEHLAGLKKLTNLNARGCHKVSQRFKQV